MNHKLFLESLIKQTVRRDKGSALGKDFHEGSPVSYHGYRPDEEEYWNNKSGSYGGHGRRKSGFQVRTADQDANLLKKDLNNDYEDDGTEAIATSPVVNVPKPSGYSSDTGYNVPKAQEVPPAAHKLQLKMRFMKINNEISRLTKEREELKKQLDGMFQKPMPFPMPPRKAI